MRSVLLATLLLALAAPAARADVSIELSPREARYGDSTQVTGTVTDAAGAPVAGVEVTLHGYRYPYDGELRPLERATTGSDGGYRFERELDRNWRLRVTTAAGETSPTGYAYVFPRVKLQYEVGRRGRSIRLLQRYRVPRGVELDRPTLFYLGRPGARRGKVVAKAKLRRTRPGRYRSTARVRIPRRWDGRFRYASCFRYTPGSGMGDPRARCPRRFEF